MFRCVQVVLCWYLSDVEFLFEVGLFCVAVVLCPLVTDEYVIPIVWYVLRVSSCCLDQQVLMKVVVNLKVKQCMLQCLLSVLQQFRLQSFKS